MDSVLPCPSPIAIFISDPGFFECTEGNMVVGLVEKVEVMEGDVSFVSEEDRMF